LEGVADWKMFTRGMEDVGVGVSVRVGVKVGVMVPSGKTVTGPLVMGRLTGRIMEVVQFEYPRAPVRFVDKMPDAETFGTTTATSIVRQRSDNGPTWVYSGLPDMLPDVPGNDPIKVSPASKFPLWFTSYQNCVVWTIPDGSDVLADNWVTEQVPLFDSVFEANLRVTMVAPPETAVAVLGVGVNQTAPLAKQRVAVEVKVAVAVGRTPVQVGVAVGVGVPVGVGVSV
jgi:hypothetical protein